MDIQKIMAKVKSHPNIKDAGMILTHNGIVRDSSRDGRKVSGFTISVDRGKLEKILEKNRLREGIVDIQAEITEKPELSVGDDVMFIVVAGDFRENVISVLSDTLNEIKSTVTSKTEFFIE